MPGIFQSGAVKTRGMNWQVGAHHDDHWRQGQALNQSLMGRLLPDDLILRRVRF
jgi:hypothetical protein